MKPVDLSIGDQRFDFGVPLEDIFHACDIHPRLKFLLEKSFESGVCSGLTIHEILRTKQESLETRLRLKETLIYETKYQEKLFFSPGTYLWLIRHFLGLLPIALIPDYTHKIKLEWKRLSDQCEDYLKHGRSFKEDSFFLNFLIVERLTHLPREHFILINYLMVFMREISKKSASNIHQQKRNLIVIANYFCSSIFLRPYRPGYKERDMLPLLLYLLLKWHEIKEVCSDIDLTTESDTNTIATTDSIRKDPLSLLFKRNEINFPKENLLNFGKGASKDRWSQTETFYCFNKSSQTSNETIVPLFTNDLRHAYSQTDTIHVTNKHSQTTSQAFIDRLMNIENEKRSLKIPPLANSTAIFSETDINETIPITNDNEITYFTAPDATTKYYSLTNNSESFVYDPNETLNGCVPRAEESQFTNKTNVSFVSALDTGSDWKNIVEQTSNTVKKLEEYFYDDYDTFTREEFNQISEGKTQSFPDKDEKSPKLRSIIEIDKNNGNENHNLVSNEDNSYIRCDNVDDIINDNISDSVAKSSFNSEEKLYDSWTVEKAMFNETKSKFNFSLKRFKIKMKFWRRLTQRNTPTKTIMDGYYNNLRYKKLKQIKANTL